MNKQLIYAKSPMKGFVNNDDWMENQLVPFTTTSTMSRDEVFAIANQNRDNCVPVFADDSKYLPTNEVSGGAGAILVNANIPAPNTVTVPTTKSTIVDTSMPKNKELINGILIGLGVVVLFKILA